MELQLFKFAPRLQAVRHAMIRNVSTRHSSWRGLGYSLSCRISKHRFLRGGITSLNTKIYHAFSKNLKTQDRHQEDMMILSGPQAGPDSD